MRDLGPQLDFITTDLNLLYLHTVGTYVQDK